MDIRSATIDDQPALTAFGARTFAETFAPDNTPEHLAAYLSKAFTAEQQRDELSDPSVRTLLGEIDGALVAYAQVRRGPAPGCVQGPSPIELVRFYVDRAWHSRGLAATLMETVAEAASTHGGQTLWLGVWERNARAIRFYAKHGFVDVGSHDFVLGTDRQTDRIMVRAL